MHCVTADLGQPDEVDLEDVRRRMIGCGASEAHVVSATEPLVAAGLEVIRSQARYEGDYWNTTGIARPVTVEAILPVLAAHGVQVFCHGATGRGNDQVRFQLACNMLDPEVTVYAPWRDPEFVEQFPGRQQMIDYCVQHDLPIRSAADARYSTDANILGLTHEAGDLEDVRISPDFVEPGMGVWPWQAPDEAGTVTVRWERGVPVAVGEERGGLVALFAEANRRAGAHGVGIGTHAVENRFVGVKSRGLYEAPGMELLGRSFEYLLQFVLDRRARELYQQLSTTISTQIYQGYWLDLATEAARAALATLAARVTGATTLRLYKGGVYFESADADTASMPHSLYTDDSSMEALGSYNHVDAEGFVNVLGVSAKTVGVVGRRDAND